MEFIILFIADNSQFLHIQSTFTILNFMNKGLFIFFCCLRLFNNVCLYAYIATLYYYLQKDYSGYLYIFVPAP